MKSIILIWGSLCPHDNSTLKMRKDRMAKQRNEIVSHFFFYSHPSSFSVTHLQDSRADTPHFDGIMEMYECCQRGSDQRRCILQEQVIMTVCLPASMWAYGIAQKEMHRDTGTLLGYISANLCHMMNHTCESVGQLAHLNSHVEQAATQVLLSG